MPTNQKLTLDIKWDYQLYYGLSCNMSAFTIDYFRSEFRLRCLTEFWIRLCSSPWSLHKITYIYIKACIYKVKLQAMVAEMLQKSNFLFYVLYLRFTIFCFYYIFHVYDICFNVYFISYLYLYHVFLFLLFTSIFILFDFKFLW